MANDDRQERDLVLLSNEYAFVSDQTKGKIDTYVGPHKTSLAGTDKLVVFNSETKRFETSPLDKSIKTLEIAPEGWYIVLKNPNFGEDEWTSESQPQKATINPLPDLAIGRKINIPGPVSFALWSGQMSRIIEGHHLRSNQYLLVRVYDEEAARKNFKSAIIKTLSDDDKPIVDNSDLTMGNLMIIKGTDVSFYIPPTGIEIVRDDCDTYVRQAETLERLEYCILLDKDGNKRYVRGPSVVFPEPTETFFIKNNKRKFNAFELNEISGIYIKVISPYSDGDKEYNIGDELFITGKDQMIYFPREEHAIIKYGDNSDIHYGIAIPSGEARYVLNRLTGEIKLHKGPDVFLPDPRKEVIVRRILDEKQIKLWFPNNKKALQYNSDLRRTLDNNNNNDNSMLFNSDMTVNYISTSLNTNSSDIGGVVGDEFKRNGEFTPPRTVTLDTKYDGAVSIDIWTGYAILVNSKSGDRKVINGPSTYLLEYNEFLEPMMLSTGKPKNADNMKDTCYLRVLHNKVSDIITAETKDLCKVDIRLSYRVNFEDDSEKWFNVENYVKLMTDHLRSLLKFSIKSYDIEEFYANSAQIIRDTILGEHTDDGRKGKLFVENGMRVYDVEVLDVVIGNEDIEELLISNQTDTISQTIELAQESRKLRAVNEKEDIKRQINAAKNETETHTLSLNLLLQKDRLENELSSLENKINVEDKKSDLEVSIQKILEFQNIEILKRDRKRDDQNLDIQQIKDEQTREMIKSETEAMKIKTEAISPDLISVLQATADKSFMEKTVESFNILSIIGGKSIPDIFNNIFKGTKFDGLFNKIVKTKKK